MDLIGAASAINGVFGPKKQPANPKARDQSLPFMFEVSGGDVAIPERFILPLNPESLRVSWPTRTNITHTKASAFQDNIGLGLPSFSLQGTFGYRGTLDKGNAARSLTGDKKSAWDLYQELEGMFRAFYLRFGTYTHRGALNLNPVDPAKPPLLNFYNFTDRDFWVVQINKFDLLRNTQRRYLYQYDIQMTGLKRVSAPMSEDALAGILSNLSAVDSMPAWLAFAKGALALYTAVSNAITTVLNTIDTIKDAVNRVVAAVKAFRAGITKLINAPFSLVTSIVKAVDSIIKTLVSFKNIPHEIINGFREMKRAMMPLSANPRLFSQDIQSVAARAITAEMAVTNAQTTLSAARAALAADPASAKKQSAVAAATAALASAQSAATTANRTAKAATTGTPTSQMQNPEILTIALPQNNAAANAYQMDTPEETLFASGSEIIRDVSVREVSIGTNDTIYSIAQKNGVDWKQLAALNNLEYPFVAKIPADLFTPSKETGGASEPISADATIIYLTGINPVPGEILVFTAPGGGEEMNVVSAVVATASGGSAELEGPLGTAFNTSVVITRHDAAVAVLKPGDKVQIPGNALAATPITDGADGSDTPSMLFGVDENVDGEGSQDVEANGDIRAVTGISNLEMQLRHRLMTLRGELSQVGHPDYGSLLPTFIGELNSPVMQERALHEAEITVLADPRIERVENASFLEEGTALYFEADIYPIGQRNATRITLPLAAQGFS